jgi:predicted RND superfamily exporter protein
VLKFVSPLPTQGDIVLFDVGGARRLRPLRRLRLREELRRQPDERAANRTTLATAGKATLFVASAVAGGYGVLAFSYGFYLHLWMAILISAAMIVSSLAAPTVLPGCC